MMSLARQSATLAALCFLTCSLGWGAGCKHTLSVAKVVRNAQALDGQIVCVRGMLAPTPIPPVVRGTLSGASPFAGGPPDGIVGGPPWPGGLVAGERH